MIGKFKVVHRMYFLYESDDKIISLLGMFLTDDAGPDASYYKNWALNPCKTSSGGNMSDLEKVNSNIVLRYDEVFNDDTEFVTTIEKFVEILDTWEQLIKEKPQEILMTREGNEIALFGIKE